MVAAMPMGTVELVERDAEVGLLDPADEARYGRGRVRVFEGEPGIGKTALVEAAVAGAEARTCSCSLLVGANWSAASPSAWCARRSSAS